MTTDKTRPTAVPVRAEGIPDALKSEHRWLCWSYVDRDGRWTKKPAARIDDPSTWSTFDRALSAYNAGGFDGIGFVLGDGWAGADLDHCRDASTGRLLPVAQVQVDALAAYTEVSPSGTGVKVFFRAERRGFQTDYGDGRFITTPWESNRYFAVTGQGSGDPTVDRSQLLAGILPKPAVALDDRPSWVPDGREGTEHIPAPASVATLSDEALLERARSATNGDKFRRLWSGDCAGYASQSEADGALCLMLAYWTQRDADRMDRLFRRSGLARRKWDSPSYRRAQITSAIRKTVSIYDPSQDVPTLPIRMGVRGIRGVVGLRGIR